MTTAELKRKVKANGLEHVLERWESEPTDNPELAALWDKTYEALEAYNNLAAVLESELGI